MSDKYETEVNELVLWFKERLPLLGELNLTLAEYGRGTDSLTGYHSMLCKGVYVEWLTMRNYDLSYNQICMAFFEAAKQLDLLTIK